MEIKYLEKLFKIQQDDAKLWGKKYTNNPYTKEIV